MILGEAHSAWNWDEQTQEYYLALFTPEQPDLNWRNPAVREAVHDVLRFWLERGVGGFRMDVINMISKVEGYPDVKVRNPDLPYQHGGEMFANGPHLHEYLREMNDKVLSKYECMTVGEMPWISDPDEIMRGVGADRKELNMIFIFDLVDIDNAPNGFRLSLNHFSVDDVRKIQTKYQRLMLERNGWNSIFIENHDNPRSVSRFTDDSDEYRALGSKLLCLMQTTLGGTLYVYQGEELGMRNLRPDVPPEEYKDVESINYWRKMQKAGQEDQGKKILQRKARDHARTPVQWTGGANAGFCDEKIKPWMCVNSDYKTVNAEAQRTYSSGTDLSVLQFWKRGMEQRKKHKDAFVYGDFILLDDTHENVLTYKRVSDKGEAFAVVLNFSGKEVEWSVPEIAKVEKWVTGNYASKTMPELPTTGTIKLRPWEGVFGEWTSVSDHFRTV